MATKLCRPGTVKSKTSASPWGIISTISSHSTSISVDLSHSRDLTIDPKFPPYFGPKSPWDKKYLSYNIEHLSIFWFKIARESPIFRVFNCFQPPIEKKGWLAVALINFPEEVCREKIGLTPVENTRLTIADSNFQVFSFKAKTAKLELPTRQEIGTFLPSAKQIKLSPVKQPDSLKSDIIGLLLVRASTLLLSWDKAIIGTESSRAKPFKFLVILANSKTLLSLLFPSINCK